MPYVNDEAKVMQEISTKDGLIDIGNDEYPPEGKAQPNMEGARAYTICRNLGNINCLQGEDALWL